MLLFSVPSVRRGPGQASILVLSERPAAGRQPQTVSSSRRPSAVPMTAPGWPSPRGRTLTALVVDEGSPVCSSAEVPAVDHLACESLLLFGWAARHLRFPRAARGPQTVFTLSLPRLLNAGCPRECFHDLLLRDDHLDSSASRFIGLHAMCCSLTALYQSVAIRERTDPRC